VMDDEPSFLPTRLEAMVQGPLSFNLDLSHNFSEGKLEAVNADLSFKVAEGTTMSLGERYTRKDSIIQKYLWDTETLIPALGLSYPDKVFFLTSSLDTVIGNKWAFNANAWYDAAEGELRDSSLKVTYRDQCWALSTSFSRRPGNSNIPSDYSFMFYIELKGLGIVRL
ncbi:MAG: hypothetical protein HGA78_03965, partial [Nitrospirales bacterium]|nr:hypothetical protein [Nitrospirales bacterium]